MSYDVKKINEKLSEEIKNNRFSLESFAEKVPTSRQTLSNWLKSDMQLSTFIRICELLNLQPSTFFLEQNGNINNAMNSPNTTQTISNTDKENDLLRQENKFLREKIEWLETRLKSEKL